jgi:hypothetical protein
LYSVRECGLDPATALQEETERLPAASPNPAFRAKLAKG